MKGGVVIEQAAKTSVVTFDKTGTLTGLRPRVTDVVSLGRPEGVVAFASAVETGSSHPLAVAILERAKADAIPVRPAADASAIAGEGVVGKLDGHAIFVGAPRHVRRAAFDKAASAAVEQLESAGGTVAAVIVGALAGLVALRDEPREDAALARSPS